MTDKNIFQSIGHLKSVNDSRKAKYYRNFRRYCYTPGASIENIKSPAIVGYWQLDESPEDDTGATPQINVIKSVIDTLTSKIAQSKVIPFFNTVNGTFKDIQIVKQAQQFFEFYYEQQNINKLVSLAFRDACIFDTGFIYINQNNGCIERLLPWQVYVSPAELTYGKLTKLYIEQKDFPVCMLPEKLKNDLTKKDYEYCTFGTYYNTIEGVKTYHTAEMSGKLYKESFDADIIPLVPLHYNEPIFGTSSQSVVDMLDSIQQEIDDIMSLISDAAALNPAMTIITPKTGDVSVNRLSNRVGNVLQYNPVPGMTTSPVTVATPQFINGQYLQLLEQYKQDAYEMVGISMLSAQSQKPTGLDSGVALQTMENIESERYETQINQVIRAYVAIAKIAIKVFPQDSNILPEQDNRVSIKWKDIVKQSERMVIQYSGADSLSKDPATKLQQLQMLAQAGIIPQTRIAQYMEIPDLDSGYSLSNNAINAVMTIIDECIEEGTLDVPDYVPFVMLKDEIINTQLSLRSNNYEKNKKDIDKLAELYKAVEAKEMQWQTATAMAQQPMVPQEGQQSTNILTGEPEMTMAPPEGPDLTNGF